MERVKSGYLEKYSVGRGLLPVRNWQRRWFNIDNRGLNYSKNPAEAPKQRTYVPFIQHVGGFMPGVTSATSSQSNFHAASGLVLGNGEVVLCPVFLYPNVTPEIHPEACDPKMSYFAIRFVEKNAPRVLLLRTNSAQERDQWVRYIALFVHAASLASGVPQCHPLAEAKKAFDPEELDAREKLLLKQAVLEWDEGAIIRSTGHVLDPFVVESAPALGGAEANNNSQPNLGGCMTVDSDDESGTQSPRRQSGSATPGQQRSGQASPLRRSSLQPGSPQSPQTQLNRPQLNNALAMPISAPPTTTTTSPLVPHGTPPRGPPPGHHQFPGFIYPPPTSNNINNSSPASTAVHQHHHHQQQQPQQYNKALRDSDDDFDGL